MLFLPNINNLFLLITILFFLGLLGICFNRKNIIMILISAELLTLSTLLNYAFIANYLDDITGHLIIIFLLTTAATESTIGLTLILLLFKLKKSIKFYYIYKNFKKL